MTGKLVALALLLGVFGAVQVLSSPAYRDSHGALLASGLMPQQVGEYRMSGRVSTPVYNGFSAELAEYRANSGAAVQMGIITDPRLHNGISCYLARGEAMQSEALRTVHTVDTVATFDVAFFREGEQLSLVANTECFGDACSESLLDDWKAQWRRLDPRSPFLAQQAAVPVTITLSGAGAADGAAAQGRLLEEFERFAGQLDLAPMRRNAAAR